MTSALQSALVSRGIIPCRKPFRQQFLRPTASHCLRSPSVAFRGNSSSLLYGTCDADIRLRQMPAGIRCVATSLAQTSPPSTQAGTDLKEVIELLIRGSNLSGSQTEAAMEALLGGAEAAQIGAFLVLLRAKGETAEEVAGLARAMRGKCVRVHTGGSTLDIVGTGGDGANTVNISTGACVLAAACGAKVAKGVARCVSEVGVGFMFAPRYHPAMAIVGPVRKALKVRTAFNILGPMLNPAVAPHALVGVYNQQMVSLMAQSLQELGMKRALVVHSKGLDEISPMGPADMLEVTPGGIRKFYVDPLDLGIQRCEVEELRGGDKHVNARLLREAFGGQRGPIADALVLNAGVGLVACGVAPDVAEGVAMAQRVQREGGATAVLDRWVQLSQELRAQEEATMAL